MIKSCPGQLKVKGSGFGVQALGFWVQGLVFRIWGSGFGVWGLGFSDWGHIGAMLGIGAKLPEWRIKWTR